MPLYEYLCGACKCVTEEIQKFSDPPLKKCEHCDTKGKMVKQLSTSGAFILKGSGWYADGYSKPGKKQK